MLPSLDRERTGGQMAENAEPLATVLTRWIRRERLRPADIERACGVSRAHLWLMTSGKVPRPTPETLRKLALGLATDPDTRVVDRLKRDHALGELSVAAGYPDFRTDADAGDLIVALRAASANHQVAEFWREMVERYPDLSPTHQQIVRSVLEQIVLRGSDDVTSLLLLLSAAGEPALAELLHRLMGDGEPARS
jgi:transcriptional regulator with XRE-family HTH domain